MERPMHGRILTALVLLSLLLVSCKTTDFAALPESGASGTETAALTTEDQGPERVSQAFYTPLYDESDHLKDLLLTDKNPEKAATLYLEQKEFFSKGTARHRDILNLLKTHLNEPKLPALKAALDRVKAIVIPTPEKQWPKIRKTLAEAEEALAPYARNDIFKESQFRAAEFDELEDAFDDLKSRLESGARAAFADFDHFGGRSFFDLYPVDINRWSFVPSNIDVIKPELATATTAQLKTFAGRYPQDVIGAGNWEHLGGLFVAAHLREGGNTGSTDLLVILGAINAAKEAGFQPKKVPGLKIAFVEVTSKTLLKQGQIDFPATVDVDLPVESARAELDDAFTNATAEKADFLIVFDVAVAKASRRVLNLSPVPSILVAGYKTVPNPNYNLVQNEVNNARLKVNQAAMNAVSANSQYCYGLGCVGKMIGQLAAGAAQQQANEALEASMTRLSATPQFIDEPIHKEYKFDKATIHARKAMTVHYYVIDRREKTYFKSTFDIAEEERFDVAYRISDKDTKWQSRLQEFDTEKEVDEFEKAASSVKLSQLVDHYLTNKGRTKPLVSLAALRREMLTDKNKALAEFKANTFDARPLNDPRFDSVVVIYTGGGALGSGFFIKPDVVLTNWHVVEEFKFVEMKTYDGQETFGKVLGKDVRLDLALIKVQSRGKPVRFYTENTVDLGATADAIGHPHRQEFSITRGVVSAIRKQFSISLPQGAGDEVLYVQTDAPINRGNSGGPLFLGDRVIGINTMGLKKDIAEGVNFSVHYSEVLAFLKEHLPGFVVLK